MTRPPERVASDRPPVPSVAYLPVPARTLRRWAWICFAVAALLAVPLRWMPMPRLAETGENPWVWQLGVVGVFVWLGWFYALEAGRERRREQRRAKQAIVLDGQPTARPGQAELSAGRVVDPLVPGA